MEIIKTNECEYGFSFVVDSDGNKLYYGSVDDCKKFIKEVKKELRIYSKGKLASMYGRSARI